MSRGNIPIFVPHVGCRGRCSFCDQRAISGAVTVPNGEEVATLCRTALESLSDSARVEIAFFGGSFTALKRGLMTELLDAVYPFLSDPRVRGIRLSTRPDAVDEDVLNTLAGYGVTTIELGAQSMYNKILAANRRGHSKEDVEKAAGMILAASFRLGLQMMTGLYKSSREADFETGVRIAKLNPHEVRIYPTVVLAGTYLDELLQAGAYTPPSLEETVDLCADLITLFEGRGIRVLRVGLQAGSLSRSQVTGGCFHPALGELCRSRLRLREMAAVLRGLESKEAVLRVHPRQASQVLGHRRQNMETLTEQGFRLKVEYDPGLGGPFEIVKMTHRSEEALHETSRDRNAGV